jgi:murein DD-endopeptidase MepM/ murein hydrolase activator NlpD
MKNKNRYKNYYAIVALIAIFGFVSVFFIDNSFAQTSSGNTTLVNLNDELRDIKNKIEDLESKKGSYKDEVEDLRKESLSLQREISLLDNKIAQIGLDIDVEQARIDQTNLEIEGVNLEIALTKKEINEKKDQLGILLNKLDRLDEIDYLNILLFNDNFAEFFDGVKFIETVEGDVFVAVQNVHNTKNKLEKSKTNIEEKRDQLVILKGGLEEKQIGLEDEEGRKNSLLSTTRFSERKFQQLILELEKEQRQANADILSLEKQIRDKLSREQALKNLGGDENFSWPTSPARGITAYFHDPSYPYRYLFEHPAIDIRASQGTSIRASKSGYVARAKDSGMGYSYIVLIHDNEFSSVYGHVSAIYVREDDFVVQGQNIGATGGAPGTPGAGSLSTGSHLHFELRQAGLPVNPLDYLP